MSLSSMLSGKSEEAKQFQSIIKNIITPKPLFATMSGKTAFSNEYEEIVPYSFSVSYNSTIVGNGFDYLARFIVAKNIENTAKKKIRL